MVLDNNINLGDTFFFPNCNAYFDTTIISIIDSLYFGTELRKRFHFGNSNESILEGAGTKFGIEIGGCPASYGIEGAIWLYCFSKNGFFSGINSSSTCNDFLILSNHPVPVPMADFSISPNPFSYSARFSFDNDSSKSYVLRVYSIIGEQVKHVIIDKSPYIFYRNNLCPGLYICVLINEKGEVMNKQKIVLE